MPRVSDPEFETSWQLPVRTRGVIANFEFLFSQSYCEISVLVSTPGKMLSIWFQQDHDTSICKAFGSFASLGSEL